MQEVSQGEFNYKVLNKITSSSKFCLDVVLLNLTENLDFVKVRTHF